MVTEVSALMAFREVEHGQLVDKGDRKTHFLIKNSPRSLLSFIAFDLSHLCTRLRLVRRLE